MDYTKYFDEFIENELQETTDDYYNLTLNTFYQELHNWFNRNYDIEKPKLRILQKYLKTKDFYNEEYEVFEGMMLRFNDIYSDSE